jgi:hypothetical protein
MKTLTEFSLVVLRRAAAARAARTAEGLEGDALIAAIAGDLSLQEDRAKRLVEALDVVGAGLDKVRLVRVFQGEKGPPGSTAVGEFHYAVDRAVVEQKRRGRDDRGDRGGRGDRDRGGGGGFGGGGMFGGPKRDKPRGLGSLKAAAAGEKPPESDDRPQRGEVPRAGIGWQLTAAPRDPRDDRGRGKGRGRPGDRRGPRGPRPDGGGPGGDRRDRGGFRGDRGPRPQGAEAGAGGGPGGGGPGGGGPGGPRPEGDRGRGRGRRGGRGRGPGGPGGPRPGGPQGPGGPREPRVNVEGAPQVQAEPGVAPPSEPATSVTTPTPPATTEPQS